MTEKHIRPWQLIEKAKEISAENRKQNRERLLAAYDSLADEGILEPSSYQLMKRDAELRHPDKEDVGFRLMGMGTAFRALDELNEQGLISARFESRAEAGDRPRRRLYRRIDHITPTE